MSVIHYNWNNSNLLEDLPSSNKTPFSTVKSPIDTGKSSNTIQLFLKCFMTMVVVFFICSSASIISCEYHIDDMFRFICSSSWADDSSVFAITCHLKSKDIPESWIGRIWTPVLSLKTYTYCKDHFIVISDNNMVVNW